MTIRVLQLVGSEVSDFFCDLSRLYAADSLRATADPERYDTRIAYVAPDGLWRFPADLEPATIAAAVPHPVGEAVQVIEGLAPDVMVPQLFCLPGMTTYRALFDLLGVPYVGNPPAAMALAAHKPRAKAVVAAAGVRTPLSSTVRRGEAAGIPMPVVVKPVDADNSVGVSLATGMGDYVEALAEAFRHSDEVLVEQYVELGREVRCGVLDLGGELVCLPLEEYAVDSDTKPVRGMADKLARSGAGDLGLVAKDAEHAWIVDPADPITAVVHEAARACHRALGCRDYSLFDFRIDPEGRPWFLEAGLYCSFAEQSVVAVMADAAGLPVADLFARCVDAALSRRRSL